MKLQLFKTRDIHIKHSKKWITKEVLVYSLLILWFLINIFPLYWMFTFSLKSNAEIFGENVIGLPNEWLWSNYETVLSVHNLGGFFVNSIIVTGITIVLTIVIGMMAAFALTRMIWKGRKVANHMVILGMTMPIHASILPIFLVLSKLKMLDSYQSLIIPYTAFALSVAILIFIGFMQEIPKELDEAACIDGCGVWRIFRHVIFPMMRPSVATVGIFTFIQAWNELMFALIFISKSEFRTLTVGIQTLSGSYTRDWGPIGASLVLATFPMIFVYAFLSKKIHESVSAGAIKG